MTENKLKLAVFISGSGSNLQALIDACQAPDFPAVITVVISNRPDAFGLERAKKANIPAEVIDHKNYKTRTDFEKALQNILDQHAVELICFAGFMRILTPEFFQHWNGRIINVHPSLLPKHGGKGMYGEHVHKAVLAAGDKESGCTIHYVIPEVDEGAVILQKRVPVYSDDTIETLSGRVLEEEHSAYPEAVRLIAEEHLKNLPA